MKEKLNDLVELCKEEIKTIKNEADYLNLKSKFLGKKSELTNLM